MTIIKNLTPHTITLLVGNDKIILHSDGIARAVATTTQIDTINGIPVNSVTMGDVVGLPAPVDDTVFIVSRIVADAVKGTRNDVVIVDKTIRDDNGQIIGCTALARV